MHSRSPRHRATRSLAVTLFLVTAIFAAGIDRAQAVPVVGFVEDFPGTSLSTWGGGSVLDNPGTGGFHGDGDGFLRVTSLTVDHLGTVSFGAEYAGNWTAAGVTQVRCWLTDLSGRGDLSIHLSLSNSLQTWQHNAGLSPPVGRWGLYVVDIAEANFTRTRGISGTFPALLQTVDRLHFRHDLAPYVGEPDLIQGSFGLDHILLTNGTAGVPIGGGIAQPVLLEPPYPNPARGRVTFQLRQPEALPVSISIFDAAGRRVREVALGTVSAAPRLWMWDGQDDAGRPVPAGVYRVLARGENGGTTRTVTILR